MRPSRSQSEWQRRQEKNARLCLSGYSYQLAAYLGNEVGGKNREESTGIYPNVSRMVSTTPQLYLNLSKITFLSLSVIVDVVLCIIFLILREIIERLQETKTTVKYRLVRYDRTNVCLYLCLVASSYQYSKNKNDSSIIQPRGYNLTFESVS